MVSDIHFSWKYENFCDGLPNTIYSSRIGGSLGVQNRRDVFEYDTPLNCELFDEDISLQLFPNPAHHFINIESPILQKEGTLIQVFDAMGRLQITQKIDIHSNRFEINLRGLEKGFYTLVIENEEDRLIEKFVVQN